MKTWGVKQMTSGILRGGGGHRGHVEDFSHFPRTPGSPPGGRVQGGEIKPRFTSCMKPKEVFGKSNPKVIAQAQIQQPLHAPFPQERLNSSHRVQERVIENSRFFFFFLNFSTSGKSLIQHLVVNH